MSNQQTRNWPELLPQLSLEGQIEHFLKNKGDHNFVWNRAFIWEAMQHLYNERTAANADKALLESRIKTFNDALLAKFEHDQKVSRINTTNLIVGVLLGYAVGMYLGWYLF